MVSQLSFFAPPALRMACHREWLLLWPEWEKCMWKSCSWHVTWARNNICYCMSVIFGGCSDSKIWRKWLNTPYLLVDDRYWARLIMSITLVLVGTVILLDSLPQMTRERKRFMKSGLSSSAKRLLSAAPFRRLQTTGHQRGYGECLGIHSLVSWLLPT